MQRRDGHRWSLDDLVTADFAAETFVGGRILDLGCGIGAVLLLLAWRFPDARLVGIEAQPSSVSLARRSVAWNGTVDRCEIRPGDFRDLAPDADGLYDLVTATPPYLRAGTATVPKRVQQAGCHIEERGGIEAYCAAAVQRMAADARFVVCHSSARRTEAAAKRAGLAVEALRGVVPREGKAPLFSVFRLRHRSVAGGPITYAPLVVRDRGGRWTEDFCSLRSRMGMPPAPDSVR